MEHRTAGQIGFVAGRWPLDPGKPTLIFIHGAGTSHLIWTSQVKALSARANTVAVDLPGHNSSRFQGKDSIAGYAGTILDFIERARIPHPVPCGLSMGGAITQHLLINNDSVFPAGILINTGARLKVLPMIFETIKKDYDKYVELTGAFAISKKNDSEALRAKVRASLQCTPEVVLGDFCACDAFDVMGQLGTISLPVLVLTASDDLLTPPKYGTFLSEGIRGAQRVNIEDAGHLSPIEKPLEVNAAIQAFLARLVL
ncbi:MAG: alpha/beta fold hydrolase [Syntrophaceae bacterium]|nr:alpha/beta hydrolase [Deltaproteobacteria bacterium]